MRILKFVPTPKPKVAILIKEQDVDETKRMTFLTQYLQKLNKLGYDKPGESIVVIGLPYPKSGNIKKDFMVAESEKILTYCDTNGIDTLLVCDSKYFPYLTSNKKTEEFIGEVFKCTVKDFEHINVLPSLHHVIISFNPSKLKTFDTALDSLTKFCKGTMTQKEEVIINYIYPQSYEELDRELSRLELSPKVAIDIESRGNEKKEALRYDKGVLSTIAISDTETSGIAFPVDEYWGINALDETRYRQRFKMFLERVLNGRTKTRLHNGLFDAKYLIYNLFMKNNTDYKGMYDGIKLFSNMDDTMVMAYLCINSTIKVDKGLKDLSREFIGNYAIDVKDITKHTLDTILKYNLQDTCATMWVGDKYEAMLDTEGQREVYETIMKPSFGFLLEMMMTGLPVNRKRTAEVKEEFETILEESYAKIQDSHHVKRCISVLKYNAMTKYNSEHKKQKTEDDFKDLEFNPASVKQMQLLLFDILGLRVKEKTDTGAPAVGADILREYQAEAKYSGDTDVEELIKAILDYAKASKMVGTFLSAIEELSSDLDNGETYLRGNLKLGGTQCVTADTLFTTNRGVIPYSKLKLNDLVITHTGAQKPIIDLFSNGVKQIYKVTTTRGHVLKTSAEHPYYVDGSWVTADKLIVGDSLKVMYESAEQLYINAMQQLSTGLTVFFDDTVLSIDILEPEETFGATVADDHSHVTNGIVTHNSGRLSSSEPNLQNLPSGGVEGKLIKSCFVAPKGWLFAGSDFSALEDRIGAILSGDENKVKEFSRDLDGLR